MLSRSRLLSLALVVCLGGLPPVFPVWAQIGGMNAEFAGGGARALAMGGAFIALADDATAVEFNPAGLWQLRRPEFAIQGIYTRDKHEDLLLGTSIEQGTVLFRDNEDVYWIPSFASLVWPTQHIVIGISEFTNILYEREYCDLARDPVTGGIGKVRIGERAENYAFGLTAASRLISEQLSVGATLRYNVFRYEYDDGTSGGKETFSDESPSFNLGLRWEAHRYFSVGAVYKSTQKLEGHFGGREVDTELPDTLGFGCALVPSDDWRVLFDVDRIEWSKFDGDPSDPIERDDVWRYHFGTEWCAGAWGDTGVFLRGGYLYEESNALRSDDPFLRDFFTGLDPVDHYTFGVGFARPRYQVDLGVDLTEDKGQDYIASLVWYF